MVPDEETLRKIIAKRILRKILEEITSNPRRDG